MCATNNNFNSADQPADRPSYKDKFTRIKPRAIEITRELIRAKPWRGNPGRGGLEEFARAYSDCFIWLKKMSKLYHIPTPLLFITKGCGSGCYDSTDNAIILPKFSVTSLAHEFRHALQHKKPIRMRCVTQAEEDARGWSVSLIYRADQRFYERARSRGLLLYS